LEFLEALGYNAVGKFESILIEGDEEAPAGLRISDGEPALQVGGETKGQERRSGFAPWLSGDARVEGVEGDRKMGRVVEGMGIPAGPTEPGDAATAAAGEGLEAPSVIRRYGGDTGAAALGNFDEVSTGDT
jgi:hypothetical protein